MSTHQPAVASSPGRSATPSFEDGHPDTKGRIDQNDPVEITPPTPIALATRETQRTEAALGDAVLRFLRIRRGPKRQEYDLDAVSFPRPQPLTHAILGMMSE